MKELDALKAALQDDLVKGIDKAITSLRATLARKSDKYNSLILLESRLSELKQKSRHGIISEEDNLLANNKIRASILEIIDELEGSDIQSTYSKGPKEAVKEPDQGTPTEKKETREWSARLVKKKELQVLLFEVKLTHKTHMIKLHDVNNNGFIYRLEVNGVKAGERKYSGVFGIAGGLANLVTRNKWSIEFTIKDKTDSYVSILSWGEAVSPQRFKKVTLIVDGQTLYSEVA